MKKSIEPWLTVSDPREAMAFYKDAFEAEETYHLETPDGGLIVRLLLGEAGIWIAGDSQAKNPLGGENLRMIFICPDPEKIFARAISGGAEEIFPVGEDHGWKLGRIKDPFGLHWEIGHQI